MSIFYGVQGLKHGKIAFFYAKRLKELTPAFITDFDMFLRVDKRCCNNGFLVNIAINSTFLKYFSDEVNR